MASTSTLKGDTESYKVLLRELVGVGEPSALLINEAKYLGDAERLALLQPPSYLYREAPLKTVI